MHMVHCPSAGIRTFYIPKKCDTPSCSNCHLPTVTELEVGSWEPLRHLCWHVLLSWFCIDFVQVSTDAGNSCVQQPVMTLRHNFPLRLLVLQLLSFSHPTDWCSLALDWESNDARSTSGWAHAITYPQHFDILWVSSLTTDHPQKKLLWPRLSNVIDVYKRNSLDWRWKNEQRKWQGSFSPCLYDLLDLVLMKFIVPCYYFLPWKKPQIKSERVTQNEVCMKGFMETWSCSSNKNFNKWV